MKVIKVIVDELPDGCTGCPYMYLDDDDSLICFALPVSEKDNLILSGEFVIPDIILRPDWCPLIDMNKIESFVYWKDEDTLAQTDELFESEEENQPTP
jgi:hypothetical protein